MLTKIVTKNVGVLRAFDTPASPQLAKFTAIYARNGRGKTTLSTVLRSAATGDASSIIGRQTLGNGGASPDVTLIFDNRPNIRFDGGAWSTKGAPIAVFDAAFISDNLHAGEKVDLEHDRKLFTVILGEDGVKLAKQQEFFNEAAKNAGAKLKAAEAALQNDLPADMTREEFLGHVPGANIDELIEAAGKELRTVQQFSRLSKMSVLQHVAVQPLASNLSETLASTLNDIQASARDRLAAHFKKHKLGREAEGWVRYGREHVVDDDCPFCGREGVDALGLVTIYDQIFGEGYQAHLGNVKAAADAVEVSLGSEKREEVSRLMASNIKATQEWAEFIQLDAIELPGLTDVLVSLASAQDKLKPLFDAKRQSPLSVLVNERGVATAHEFVQGAIDRVVTYNGVVDSINELIEARRSGPQPTETQAKSKIENLGRRKRRADVGVQTRVEEMFRAKRRDARAKKIRSVVQERLKTANETAAAHYHERVNFYLKKFGASFQISKITNAMTGNLGSVDYGLIVRGHPVGRGRKGANDDEPTFKNTLSTGDKTTLAFSFFLAGLDRDVGLANKVLVFDDPMSSHDSHRQDRTIDFISHLCSRCDQVILLSHDAFFLRRASGRCLKADQVAYEIESEGVEQWSRLRPADLDLLCRDSHSKLVDQLEAYHDARTGDATQIAPAVRKVLETHYRRSFSAYFDRKDFLGQIIGKIREAGAVHPCHGDLQDLDSCNAGTNEEHHGDDPQVAARLPIDPDELHLIVSDCLRLIGVRRREMRPLAEVA